MTNWIYWVSKRFNSVDFKGRTAITSRLASLGIAFGVMALIAVMSVMNGFQMEYIDAILEVSSYHLQAKDISNQETFKKACDENPLVKCAIPFYESKGLLIDTDTGHEGAALIRALPSDVIQKDTGFAKEIELISGEFDLEMDDTIVLGAGLARSLGADVGSIVNIMAASGSSNAPLFSSERMFIVTGVFRTNYTDINSAYAFISLDAAELHLGSEEPERIYGIKLLDSTKDAVVASQEPFKYPNAYTESWREYNRTFFGALRVEKNVLMLLVILIFIVVAVNIYNAMRRMIYERRQDIAVLAALGGRKRQVEHVFSLKGLMTGIKGAVPGLILGIVISLNMDKVFLALAKIQYWLQYAFTRIISPEDAIYVRENTMFAIYASVPARIKIPEVIAIFLFGILSALISSILAGRRITKLNVSEVLRDE